MRQSCTARGCSYPGTAFHCGIGGCHETFISLAGFDAHRQGAVDDRYCAAPSLVDLIPDDGLWGAQEEVALRRKRVALITKARAAR